MTKAPLCLNLDSIEHTFINCQESTDFFTKTLGWFNVFHKTKIKLSLFNLQYLCSSTVYLFQNYAKYLAVISTARKSFRSFGQYFIKSEKKIKMLFTSQCGSVLAKTVSSVLSMALGSTQDRGRKHRDSQFTNLTPYTLTSVYIFSTLFFINFLRC